MRLIILAASGDDGLDWLDRFMDTSDDDRTNDGAVGDVHDVLATMIYPGVYDRLGTLLDPNGIHWLGDGVRKIIRTDAWLLDLRVERALHALNARHPLCDPTGLLGTQTEMLEARRGWAPFGPSTAPLGVRMQRNVKREASTPRKARFPNKLAGLA